MQRKVSALLAIGLSLCASSALAYTGATIIMMWPGVNGGVTTVGYVGGIGLTAYTQSFLSPLSPTGPGKPSCGVVILQKNIDIASTAFMTHGMTGKVIPKLTINFPQTDVATLVDPLTITLINAYVTSVQQGDPTLHGVTETITLQAQEFEFTDYPINNTGVLGPPLKFGWNCVTDTVVSF